MNIQNNEVGQLRYRSRYFLGIFAQESIIIDMKHKDELKLIREMINQTNQSTTKQYTMSDTDELFEYMWLKPYHTGLLVDIFVDDGGSYIRNNHELLLFVRNGYDKSCNSFIPMSVSNMPSVLDDVMDFNIKYDDIFLVQDFIQMNEILLHKLADNKISQSDFINKIKLVNHLEKIVVENKSLLLEMATLKSEDSGLPMDIWLDEGATFQGHAPRLKFRASNEQGNTREYSSMLLVNPPTIENMPKNSPLRKKDIEKLESFVIENLAILLQLAKGEIDYTKSFLSKIKRQ